MARANSVLPQKIVKATCPHCRTKGVALEVRAIQYWNEEAMASPSGFFNNWDTFATCGLCQRGVVVVFQPPRDIPRSGDTWKDFLRADPPLLEVLPPPPSSRAPRHTPDNVASFLKQAKASLPGNCDAAGAMFRKTLETALKDKLPQIEDKVPLAARIKKAAEQQALTPDLAKWADKIRLDGNSAAHDAEPFSRKDAEQLDVFTDLVLQYLYTLPGMLKEARGETEDS